MLLINGINEEFCSLSNVIREEEDDIYTLDLKKQKPQKIYNRVKKDALWKTLLRMMRKYYQDLFVENGLGKGKDHWSHETRIT